MLSSRLSFIALFVAATGASVAHADRAIASCESDADCGADQYCALSDCGPACDPDDVTCEPTDCGSGGTCFDIEVPPADCVTDADCASGDVCIVETLESCSGGGSEPNPGDPDGEGDAAPPRDPPTDCKVETYAYCAPQWLDDCTVDSDCGAGFTCEFANTSTCACTAPDGDDSTDECACEDSVATEGYCALEIIACTDDSECDGDFVCFFEDESICGAEDCGSSGSDDAPRAPELAAPEGYCAPAGFNGPREEEEGGEGEGETPTVVDDVNEDEDEDEGEGEGEGEGDDEETTWGDIFGINCASTEASPAAALPFLALALGLRRRRQR